jgi:hypothetical protein
LSKAYVPLTLLLVSVVKIKLNINNISFPHSLNDVNSCCSPPFIG